MASLIMFVLLCTVVVSLERLFSCYQIENYLYFSENIRTLRFNAFIWLFLLSLSCTMLGVYLNIDDQNDGNSCCSCFLISDP